LIGLFGIAVQNSLVLVTQIRTLMAEGRSMSEAVREASLGRVRPKLLTAGTATLGLLPLLVLQLHGTEIERPLAIVMIGGLVTSTLFTLLVLPTFYLVARRQTPNSQFPTSNFPTPASQESPDPGSWELEVGS
jgi:cobalt-zinc-cadmium resistance protein CzcA